MRVLAPFLTLGTALKSRFINIEAFIEMLEGAIAQDPVIDTPRTGLNGGSKRLEFSGAYALWIENAV